MPLLRAELRTAKGKGPVRQARRNGYVPAVVYARGEPTRELLVKAREFGDLLDEIKGQIGLIDLQIGEEPPVKCLVKQIQRHSVSLQLSHVDFQKVHAHEKVSIAVPIHLTGTPIGTKMGGLLEHSLRALPVRGMPEDLPPSITVDITGLKLGQTLHVSDLKLTGVEVEIAPTTPVASVITPRKLEEAAPAAAAAAPVEAEEAKEPEVISEKKAAERAEERAKQEAAEKGKPKEEKKEEKKK
ncbi:MAG: 50S ribosomal protein L25 [candidate division WOR-3 bacterium]